MFYFQPPLLVCVISVMVVLNMKVYLVTRGEEANKFLHNVLIFYILLQQKGKMRINF